jgi:hypothetical protein
MKRLKRWEYMRNFKYKAALLLYPIIVSLRMKGSIDRHNQKKRYRYSINIWNSWINSMMPPYRMNFLEGMKGIDRDDVLYVMEEHIDEDNLNKMKTNGYDCCYFGEMVQQFSVWQYFRDFLFDTINMSQKMFKTCNNKALIAETYFKTLRGHIRWEIFHACYTVDLSVTAQYPGYIHSVLFQKRHGSKCVFVFWSTSYDPVYREDMNTHGDSYYSCLAYDEMISSRMSNDYFTKNINFIGKYIDCGVLRSDIVFRTRKDVHLKARLRKKLGVPPGMTVIGFFDTKMGATGIFSSHEGVNMFEDVYRLLEEKSDYYCIYRSRGYSYLLPDSDLKGKVDRLISHPRVSYINKLAPRYNAFDIMGVCDLCIGAFTSSAPQESIAGTVPTICYVPSDRFDKEKFVINTFPHFCARGYDQLKKYAEYWLDECSEHDFQLFLETYIKKYIDRYCDGQATNRLQVLLRQDCGQKAKLSSKDIKMVKR